MGKIKLKGLEFHAFHGVYEEEKVNGNTFIVDISVETDTSISEKSDNISDTLDYVRVYELIKLEMDTPSNLLENVAFRINNSISTLVKKGKIKTTIYKQNPPIGGDCESTSVTLKMKI